MANNHIITRHIGDLRGFSTDSIFIRPANVADTAINIQRAPDKTTQLRRGYQCQISDIGGMGIGTFDETASNEVQTATIGTDGFLYSKVTRQISFYYFGQVSGIITGITQANPASVTSAAHGLQTGAILVLDEIEGMSNLNNQTYTITVTGSNTYTLDGVDSTLFPAYVSGGTWVVKFTDYRYLTFSIFTDPRYIYVNGKQSITCNITVNRAAQVNGSQSLVNTVNVEFGHQLNTGDVINFISSSGVFTQRNVVSSTSFTITFDGTPVSFSDGAYINQFVEVAFGKGFDVAQPFLISDFISAITDPVTGIYDLVVDINGEDFHPAAFLQIVEPTIIDSNNEFVINFWYWRMVNSTINPPFPGSANTAYQNSPNFENASFAAYDDVLFIANGWDFPQKYDGQTVYRAGMPPGIRPNAADNTVYPILPFSSGDIYQYITTYEQVDNYGHIVEGESSEIWSHTVGTTKSAIDVTVTNLISTPGANWNTNGAIADGGLATVYGPDGNGFYYDLVDVSNDNTMKVGDSAYYLNETAAQITSTPSSSITINVTPGFDVVPGDTVYFPDSTPVQIMRQVVSVTTSSITIAGAPVTVTTGDYIQVYRVSPVFGDVGIVVGNQTHVTTINVKSGHTLDLADLVEFTDINNQIQRRFVIGVSATTVSFTGNAVSVSDGTLIAAENIDVLNTSLNLQHTNPNGVTLGASAPISNNLRINIYRTVEGAVFGVNGEIFLVASIPNNSLGSATQIYTDDIADDELGAIYEDPAPDEVHNPPPISKYLKSFGNQLFYAGGERGVSENSDRVFFSEGNSPEYVPLATNFFNVPNVDDEITGMGVSGTTLITTKNHSLWAATGNFLSGQIDVVQIAPGTNIGCVANATIISVGTLLYFLHTNGVYAITENQLYPTDSFGNPIPISTPIDVIFRETNYLPQTRYVLKRAVACNYVKDNQYLLFLPCEDLKDTIRTANSNSIILCYDYQDKNWYTWNNMNAAGGIFVINDDLYFQERRYSGMDGNTANLYKQHRFYRLVDHADHADAQYCTWISSWEDIGQPEVRKKFCRCILLMDRLSELLQYNNPKINFFTCLNRLPFLKNTITTINQVDNTRNSSWGFSPWGWNFWAGYQDSFITVNLKQGTVAKSMQVGFTIQGINMDIRLAGFQLEVIPENRKTVVR